MKETTPFQTFVEEAPKSNRLMPEARMFRKLRILIFFTILLTSCAVLIRKQPLPQIEDDLRTALSEYLIRNFQTPEDYVVGKFRDHDIVFIGEFHRIKQNVELIQNLIPRLYQNGVYNLGMEFASFADQGKIDTLITAETYDEVLANQILFNNFVFWGYQEYADIFKAAWELNHQVGNKAPLFRVVGLNTQADWSYVQDARDLENPEIMRKVWSRGDGDEIMAATVLDEFVTKGLKALIYSGSHHAFTEYKQPIYDEKNKKFLRFVETRMGNRVFKVIGKRAITLFLHSPWIGEKGYSEPSVYPVDGVIDALMPTLAPAYRNVGFDVKGSPFGRLPAETSLYKYGYDPFVLSDFCDGYIYQCALSEYKGVTPIEGFVNAENLAEAKNQSPNPRFKRPSVTPGDFNRSISRDADIHRRFRSFR